MKTDITDKNILVVGLGVTGLSVVNHLLKFVTHEHIKVIDTRENAPGGINCPPAFFYILVVGIWSGCFKQI